MFLCRSSRIATWVWWMLVVRCSALVLGIPLVQEDVGLDQEITKNRLPRQVETFAPLWQQVMFPWLDIIYDIKNKIYKIFDSYKSPSKLVLSHKFHDEAAYKEQVKKNRKFLDDIGKRSVDAADGIAREHVFED